MECDRCGDPSPGITKMSWFNMDTICMPCVEIEKAHPQFEEAKEKERQECLSGNMNYRGIGLPKDLQHGN